MSSDEADALKNSSFAVSDGAAVAVKYGDVNGNSKINIVDVAVMRRYIVGEQDIPQ